MTQLVFDMDFLIFEAVSVAEERFIAVTHRPTGRKMEFANKTLLWGDWRKKVGGWIGEQNAELGEEYWKAEDFDVIEGQRPRPFKIKGVNPFSNEPDDSLDYFITPWEGAKKILDDKIAAICKKLGTTEYIGYTGTGNVFRHDLCTLLMYKDRDELMKPLLLKKMKEYVCERHSTTMVTVLEADDYCNVATHNGYLKWIKDGKKDCDKVISVQIDKDGKQCSGWHYNPNKDNEPRLIEGFGSLWLDSKGDVDGCGRMWTYFQTGSSDCADNYCANCFSDKKWGEKSAYKELKDCKNDKQAFEALVRIFKHLYPEKKTVQGCKGPVEIDAIYVMQECFTMAKMLKSVDEGVTDVRAVMDKLGVDYK
jgi:hypothetical protein